MKKMASFIMSLFLLAFLSLPLIPADPILPPESPQNSVVTKGEIDPPSQPASQATLPDVIVDEH